MTVGPTNHFKRRVIKLVFSERPTCTCRVYGSDVADFARLAAVLEHPCWVDPAVSVLRPLCTLHVVVLVAAGSCKGK